MPIPGKVFISHATENADMAHRLADSLAELGFTVWIAPDNIQPGENFVNAISRGLEESSGLVLLLTSAALRSPWVNQEMSTAILLEKERSFLILPLIVETVSESDIPLLWRIYQRIPFSDYERGFALLQEALLAKGVRVAQEARLLVEPFCTLQAREEIFDLALSPDGCSLVAASRTGDILRWAFPSGRSFPSIKAHSQAVRSVSFSPHNTALATASSDATIRLWEWPEAGVLTVIEEHSDTVWEVAFSPSGRSLVSGSKDSTLRVWSVPEGRCLRVLEGHDKSVYGVALSSDEMWIASASSDRTVCLWPTDGRERVVLGESTGTFLCVAFSPDSALVAAGNWGGSIHLWDVISRKRMRILEGHNDRVYCVTFSPDGTLLASGSKDGSVRLWQMPACTPVYSPIRVHDGWIRGLVFSPDGQFMISGDSAGIIHVWRIQTDLLLAVGEQ